MRGHDATGRPLTTTGTPTGYTPAQLRAYLGLHGHGEGQTVAIVDAFDDPYIVHDVNVFSRQFHLPRVCGTPHAGDDCFHFTVKHPDGFAGSNPNWALETALDVQTVHAIAPKASIVLVEAYDNSLDSLFSAIDHAAAHRSAAISNSWGTSLEFTGETAYDSHCQTRKSVCVFASGDTGNPVGYPATSPYVLAVGGTTLHLDDDGDVTSEVAWRGSGGGISYIEPKPAYQDRVNASDYRATPDVSFDADPATGVPVYDSMSTSGNGHWFQVGGTSLGAPAWAGILAVTDQVRAEHGKPPLTARNFRTHKALYRADFGLADITEGTNGPPTLCGPQCEAGPGYDTVTGLGSPRPGIDLALTYTTRRHSR